MARSLFPSLSSVSLLFILAAASGCSAPDPDRSCPPTDTLARVVAIHGPTVEVQLLQSSQGSGNAVVHTESARFLQFAGSLDECFEAKREDLREGQEISFQAGAWAESYPPQTRADAVVIRG